MMPTVYQSDLFIPRYRPISRGRWELRVVPMNMAPGYWTMSALVENMAVLLRDRQSWMSTTPLEIESQEIGVHLARGHVLIYGMGMGWSALASALQDAVTAVTDRPVDLLMPDIWLPMLNDGRVDEVRQMQANVQAGAIYFWGQELEIARHAVAAGHALDDDGIAAAIAGMGLPLVGPEHPGYTEKLVAAARTQPERRGVGIVCPPAACGVAVAQDGGQTVLHALPRGRKRVGERCIGAGKIRRLDPEPPVDPGIGREGGGEIALHRHRRRPAAVVDVPGHGVEDRRPGQRPQFRPAEIMVEQPRADAGAVGHHPGGRRLQPRRQQHLRRRGKDEIPPAAGRIVMPCHMSLLDSLSGCSID